jgi:hypothetical protein
LTEALAATLLAKAGLGGRVLGLTRLAGGRNNRVFRVDRDSGPPLALKLYHHDPRDPRDRLGAEWAFLDYATRVCGLSKVPAPLARDAAQHAALYGWLPGARVAAVGQHEAQAAIGFIAALNSAAARSAAAALAPASEACFTLDQHRATVARRVARLVGGLDPAAPHAEAAASFVADRLAPAWARIEATLPADAAPAAWIVSPSDFGFHNALVDADGGVGFLDFEYAGRDDPAKLVCDMVCQPDLPVPMAFWTAIRDAIAPAAAARCEALLPAYRIKWACIILNDFLATDAARRDFAEGADRASRCAAQLAKARTLLDLS